MNTAELRSLTEGDLDTREENVYRLVDRVREYGDEKAAEALRTVVRDYRDFHRQIYCRALNRVDAFVDASLEAPLLEALADRRYGCQAWAAMGLAALGSRNAVPGVVALLDHRDPYAQEQAVIALGDIGDEREVAVLTPLLGADLEWMRARAAEALTRIGGDAALDALWAAFERRGFPRIGYIASALATFTPEVLPRLIAATNADDPNRRYWAAVALGSTGDERAVATLEHLMATDQGKTVFDGVVSVAAKKALRTLRRIQSAIAARAEAPGDA